MPSPAPEQSGVAGSQPSGNGAPKLGAFEAPSVATSDGKRQAPAQTSTTGMTLNPDSGQMSATKAPVAIPDVKWEKPKTLVESTSKTPGNKAVITYVADGDTAYYNDKDGNQVQCRVDSFDAPETAKPKYGKKGQPYGEEASEALKNMILNKEVTVRISNPAQEGKNFNRSTCQIEIEGKNIDQEMIRQGAAWVYKTFRNNPELVGAENEARSAKRGLWALPLPQDPAEFRKMERYGK